MNNRSCKCCKDKTTSPGNGNNVYGFNRLEGQDREWAAKNYFSKAEYCVPVKGGKKFGGDKWQKEKCGDGRMGFSTRRKNQDESRFVLGLDGQLKKRRGTLVNHKSSLATASRRPRRIDGSKCSLINQDQLLEIRRDPLVTARRKRAHKKKIRANNRNNAARRGHAKLKLAESIL